MNMEVLAEGVETQRQLDFLQAHNCKQIQGFYFCRPIPAEELQKLLENPKIINTMMGQEI
jgi:EAL domain-containing protein (putative c-di-GMP-specific phosphodiesterase class I)